MRITKKVASVVLAVLMVVSMMSVMAVSASAVSAVCILDDTTEYTTVADAVAAITDSNTHTIKLLADTTSTGNIGLYQGSWDNRTGGKNVVLDLNGFTYTQNKVKGTGAFVLAPASDWSEGSSLTVKDTSSAKTGKITSNSKYTTIQCGSMCTFTLEKGTIENTGDGTALQVSGSGEATLKSGSLVAAGTGVYMYPASGNNAPVLNVQGSTITAPYAIYTDNEYDADDNVSQYGECVVNLKSGTLNGDYGFIQYDKGTITVSGGTVNSTYPFWTADEEGSEIIVKGGTFATDPEDFVDTSVYNIQYTNLQGKVQYMSAFPSALSDGTYKLLGDVTRTTRLVPGSLVYDVTIDLNGNTLTSTASDYAVYLNRKGSDAEARKFVLTDTSASGGGKLKATNLSASDSADAVFVVNNVYNNLTINNVSIESPACGVAMLSENQNVTINNSSITSTNDFALATNGSSTKNGTITVTNSELTSTNNVGVYLPGDAEATFTDTDVTGTTALYVKGGNVTINGGTFTGTGAKADFTHSGNGCNATGDAVVVENCSYPAGAPLVSITDGIFKSANAEAVASYAYGSGNDAVNNIISGGNFSSDVTPLVVDGLMADDIGAVAGAPFVITTDTNPLNPVDVETITDGNDFGLNCKYLKGTLLGVQKKSQVEAVTSEDGAQETGNDLRFVAVIDTDLVQDADVTDYGFVLAKVENTKTTTNTNFNGLQVGRGAGEKYISAKGTYNTVCGTTEEALKYGDPEDTSTEYKYVTCAVNGVDDASKIAVRFYVTKGGKTYYAKYAGHNYNYTGCTAGIDANGDVY